MGSKTALLSPILSDVAILTASDAVAGAAAANLQDPRATLYWQSTTSTPYLVFYIASGADMNALFLGYLNAGGANQSRTVRIRRATSQANLTAAPSWDSAALSIENAGNVAYLRPHVLMRFDATTGGGTGSWWRIDFGWGSSTDGFVRAARAILGIEFRPVDSAAPGWQMQQQETVVETEDMGGGLSTRPRGVRRSLQLEWHPGGLTVDEGARMQEFLLERGSARDFVTCVDVTETAHPMSVLYCGRAKQQFTLKHVPLAYRQAGFTIEEMGVTEMVR